MSHQRILHQMNLHHMQCNQLLSICNKDFTLVSSVWFLHVLKLSHALTKHLSEFPEIPVVIRSHFERGSVSLSLTRSYKHFYMENLL